MPCYQIINIASFDCPFSIFLNFSIVFGGIFGAMIFFRNL
jgi:hypothetical protein